MAQDKAKSVIITFKPKDQRPDRDKDKVAVVQSVLKEEKKFFNAADMSRGQAVPSGMPESMIGYDVNQYEGQPSVTAETSRLGSPRSGLPRRGAAPGERRSRSSWWTPVSTAAIPT